MGIRSNDMEKDIIKTYQHLDSFSTSTEIFQWLSSLCQTISDKINLSAQSRQEHVCTATINYIHQHYQDNTLCLNEIANNVHISPAHLSALFKKQRQQNISDVITDIRIETACNLLKNTNLSLKEISAKVGYSNQYYFSSCFKKKPDRHLHPIDSRIYILFLLFISVIIYNCFIKIQLLTPIVPTVTKNLREETIMNFIQKNFKGILVCFLIAIPSWLIGKSIPGNRRTCHCDSRRNGDHLLLD